MSIFTTTLSALVRDTRYLAGAVLLISMLYASCARELPEPRPGVAASGEQRKPSTEAEIALVERIKDVSAVLKSVYKDPAVVAEVNAAITSGYYEDERVILADLLNPAQSPLYRFLEQRKIETGKPGGPVRWGAFSEAFRAAAPGVLGTRSASELFSAASGIVAAINAVTSPPEPVSLRGERPESRQLPGNAISIYYPYSEDFSPQDRPLVVPATVEADWVDVPDPACTKAHRHDGEHCIRIRVDESYVLKNPVHIIGSGAETSAAASHPVGLPALRSFTPDLIYLGKVRCTRQYDRLISFTGNGGGSELKFVRGEAYIMMNDDQQVTDTEFDVITVYFRRKDIRKEREKDVYTIWDPHWEAGRTEQVFGIYEEDTRGEREFSGSIKTEVKHPGGESTITPVSYSYSVHTQDNIIRQINWSRASFFHYNRSGLAGCGRRNGYTWYDCRLPVSYSLPER